MMVFGDAKDVLHKVLDALKGERPSEIGDSASIPLF